MSRRRKRAAGDLPPDSAPGAPRRGSELSRNDAQDARGPLTGRVLRDVAVLLLAFGAGVGIAELFGAANLGVAFGVGQIVFAIALVVILTRG